MSIENTSIAPIPARVLGERIQPLDELANIALSSSSSSPSSSYTPQKRKKPHGDRVQIDIERQNPPDQIHSFLHR
jgi:hypothetical protein